MVRWHGNQYNAIHTLMDLYYEHKLGKEEGRAKSDYLYHQGLKQIPFVGKIVTAYDNYQNLVNYMDLYDLDWSDLYVHKDPFNVGASGAAVSAGFDFVSGNINRLYKSLKTEKAAEKRFLKKYSKYMV